MMLEGVVPVSTTIIGRYRVNQILSEFDSETTVLGLPVKNYKCFDEVTNQDVVVKAIATPEDQKLRDLAINIWEQDVRLSRKAISLTNGSSLLKLLDARLDDSENLLINVLEYYENTLEVMIKSNPNHAFFSKNLLHRNISPSKEKRQHNLW